jgi:hypothetical protein
MTIKVTIALIAVCGGITWLAIKFPMLALLLTLWVIAVSLGIALIHGGARGMGE